jgi:cytochrome b6
LPSIVGFAKNITDAVAIFLWLDDRLALQELLDDVASKYVPLILYCFGGLVLRVDFYYRPLLSDALASVRSIMSSVRAGWLHVCRVYLTGGFKKPREVTWVTGITLAVCTVSFGVTGYSLPYDQVGYWALRIVSGRSPVMWKIYRTPVQLNAGRAYSTLVRKVRPWELGW